MRARLLTRAAPTTCSRAWLLLALASSLIARPARAGVDDHARLEARVIAEQGDEQFYAGRCDRAIPLWRRADDVYHAPTIVLRVARCQALLGKVVAASSSLQSIVDEPIPADAPPAFFAAREDARRELPQVRARVATLRIAVRPRGPSDRPASPVPVELEIDGAPRAATPEALPIDPGTHQVRVSAGSATWNREVHLADGESRTLDVSLWVEPLPSVPPLQRNVGLGAFAVGVTALATGVGLSVSALSSSRSLQSLCSGSAPCPPAAQANLDRTRAYSLAADGTLAGGAVSIAAGAVLLTTDLHLGRDVRVRVLASPRGVGIAGKF